MKARSGGGPHTTPSISCELKHGLPAETHDLFSLGEGSSNIHRLFPMKTSLRSPVGPGRTFHVKQGGGDEPRKPLRLPTSGSSRRWASPGALWMCRDAAGCTLGPSRSGRTSSSIHQSGARARKERGDGEHAVGLRRAVWDGGPPQEAHSTFATRARGCSAAAQIWSPRMRVGCRAACFMAASRTAHRAHASRSVLAGAQGPIKTGSFCASSLSCLA